MSNEKHTPEQIREEAFIYARTALKDSWEKQSGYTTDFDKRVRDKAEGYIAGVASQSLELAKTKEELRIVEEEFKKLQDGVVSLIQKAHRDKAQVKVIYLEKLIAE